MDMGRTAGALVGLALVTTLARPAAAERPTPLVGIAGRTLEDAVLVGQAGELYRREGGRWTRRTLGGVAANLVVARDAGSDEIWALGGQAPPYRHDGRTWSAFPLGQQGAALLSSGGVPAVAVARRVFVWTNGRFGPLPAPGAPSVAAVWAAGPRDALVITGDGELRRFDGAKWKALPVKLPGASERLVRLLAGAAPGGPVVAASDGGTLVAVSGATTTTLKVDARLGVFVPRLAAAGAKGKRLLLVGDAVVDGRAVRALAQVEGGQVTFVDEVPGADDPVGLLQDLDGSVVVPLRGSVQIRAPDGGWTAEPVERTTPTSAPRPANPPAPLP